MLALKNKVSNHLSRFFADSPISSSSSPSSGGSRRSGSATSHSFSLSIPSFSLKPSKPEADRKEDHDYDHLKNEDDDPLTPRVKRDEIIVNQNESEIDYGSPLDPLSNLTDESSFITPDLYKFLEPSLPNIVKGCRWALLYSTKKDGISLKTLIRKSAESSGPCLLIAGDRKGAVFGGLLESPLTPTPKRKYQGGNQSFVFTTMHGDPKLYRPTGKNRYFYLCMNDLLAMGGGANFALRLDGDLLHGSSGPCETFGNSCLASSQEFELKNVEMWGFTHSAKR